MVALSATAAWVALVELALAGVALVWVSKPLRAFAHRLRASSPQVHIEEIAKEPDVAAMWARRKAIAIDAINNARESLKLRVDILCPQIYDDGQVASALRRALDRGVKVKILGSADVLNLERLHYEVTQLLGHERMAILSSPSPTPKRHYQIIDDRDIFIESEHARGLPPDRVWWVQASQRRLREFGREWRAAMTGAEPAAGRDRSERLVLVPSPAHT